MNRLDRPDFFDDDAALDALAVNKRLASYPHLIPYVDAIKLGYAQYVAVQGNATEVPPIALPAPVAAYLRSLYGSPPKDIAYIDEIRARSDANTCSMCGSFHSGTLDHVLPKIDHAAFAIFGGNLVPACKCNGLRSTALTGPNPGERILHPYFDDILRERLLVARFEDLGAVPKISLALLLAPADPHYAAARFHVENVVERTSIVRHLSKSWSKLIRRPSLTSSDLRSDPQSAAELAQILQRELERLDDIHDGRNNWNSIFVAGLLDPDVLTWLFTGFGRAGRQPDGSLIPDIL